jgi:F-type H+-transporting ATPase subunit delta
MRGSSRASLAAAKEQLAAITAAGADPGRLGDELFAVTGLLDAEPALRRTLADPTREARAKASLAGDLLGGKIAPATLDLVTELVSVPWSEPADLASSAEQLAVLAVAETADRGGILDDLEDELFRFGRVVNAEPELRIALSNPFVPAGPKRELLDTLLGGKVTEPTLRLITQAAVQGRGRSLDASLEEFARLAAERRERLLAEVHVAIALTAEQRRRLAAALAEMYGHDVHLNVVLDPKVIGGMSVQVAGDLIDGSMTGRLAELRRRLGRLAASAR